MNSALTPKDPQIQRLIETLTAFSEEEFRNRFSDDENCLAFLFDFKYSNQRKCQSCKNKFRYVRGQGERIYQCLFCDNRIDPTANTPFYESLLTLSMWFNELYSLKEYPLMQKIELMRIVNVER